MDMKARGTAQIVKGDESLLGEIQCLEEYLVATLAAPADQPPPYPVLTDPSLDRILEVIRDRLMPYREIFHGVEKDLSGFAECDFTRPMATPAGELADSARSTMIRLSSNLRESMNQMLDFSAAIVRQAQSLGEKNTELSDRTGRQAAALEQASAAVEQLTSTAQDNQQGADEVVARVEASRQRALDSLGIVERMSKVMEEVSRGMKGVEAITGKINAITFQTNILALNAAVEASRAGESGRSFAVVATEIRDLSTRCGEASREISQIVDVAQARVREANAFSQRAVSEIQRTADEAEASEHSIQEMNQRIAEQKQAIEDINRQIFSIDSATQENVQLTQFLGQAIRHLSDQSGFMTDAVKVFAVPDREASLHPRHQEASEIAMASARRVGEIWEEAILRGWVSEPDLFERRYKAIPGTDPKKYSTRYDELADDLLTPLQESVLKEHAFLVFSIAADVNGYVPTHNVKFSEPLTGDRDYDLVHNRTKRVFRDRVGRVCGGHEDPWKLQIYRRDTGELMFDMSAPVYIRGQHWGCFRIGYRV
ncbi:MAG: hypothetical protein JNJ44_01745 [Zoogloeaceae bacterium]|nr:hypothetical protein [Zoogloeaceae bacterium]